ncbi:MAG: ATP-dependent exonuclease beta subunit, helicase and exonuclease [Nitrospirae bacterium]|nr:ATP-dependent exonuclease beta subunit, helicase and exonuclease [Nitrospirota bacterium]
MNKKLGKNMYLSDQAARDAIVTELDMTMMVEAGAGSGKTTSLVNRMVALIGEGKATIEKISAVTFTRKAAAELRQKFQIELEKRFKDSAGRQKELYGRALADLEQVFAGTIHSFCARLLRERPVEAGIDPAFLEMDEIEDRIHQDEVWEEYLIRLLYEDGDALEILHNLDVTSRELREIYHTLALYPEVKPFTKEVSAPDIINARKELRAFISYSSKNLPEGMPEKGWDAVQDAVRDAKRMIRALRPEDMRDFFRILGTFEKNMKVTQNRWASKEIAKDIQSRIKKFQEDVVIPSLRKWREFRHFHLMKAVRPAADLCRQRRREKSTVNFQDLLMNASQMLRDNPEVRTYFRKRFTHILIDEFQDTDPIQAEVMLYLTGTDVEEKDWHKLKPEQGSLFVVGDPKQSIYRFRRADIDTYNLVKEIVRRSGGMLAELRSNFRSMESIGAWLNPIFSEKFPKDGSRYQASFGELQTVRRDEPEFTSGVRTITISKKERNKAEAIVEEDAERIASYIRAALDGKIKLARTDGEKKAELDERPVPSDFLILLHNRKMIPEYARRLEAYGIPFEVSGGNALKSAFGLREVIRILKAVAEPDSTVDLVSALRGLFFGISDDMLYRFKRNGGRFNFYSSVPEDMESDVKAAFKNAFDKLSHYKDWSKTLPPSVAIEKIIEDVGLIPYLLSDVMGGSQTGNILKVLEFLQHSDMEGTADFLSVVEELDSLLAEGEMDETDISHGGMKAVRIMNLHKAKGLEAPVVFLANPSGKSDHMITLHIQRQGTDAVGYYVITLKTNTYKINLLAIPPGWDTFVTEESNYHKAEEDRLLYVAGTRAKNLLVISTYPYNEDINYWAPFDQHRDTVQELESPAISEAKIQEKVAVKKKQFDKAQETLGRNISKIKQQSYFIENVTSLTKTTGDLPVWKRTGRGLKWGRVMHRILEAVGKGMKGTELDLLISNVLNEEGRPPEEMMTVKMLMSQIEASEFWNEVQAAEEKYFEVPFSLRLKPSELALPASSGEWAILSGTIDLIYRNHDGWTIVDYKTDDVGEQMEDFVKYYSPQVKAYSRFWEEITGEKVTKAGLYFIHAKQFVTVSL